MFRSSTAVDQPDSDGTAGQLVHLEQFRRPEGRSGDIWVHALFACLALLFFFPALVTGRTIQPTDVLSLYYPWALQHSDGMYRLMREDVMSHAYVLNEYLSSMLHSGVFPLWNPLILGGEPFLAGAKSGGLYPPVFILFALLPVDVAAMFLYLLHMALAGSFTFLLLRYVGLSKPAAVLGGAVWTLNGQNLFMLGFHETEVMSALLPLGTLGVLTLVDRPSLWTAARLAAIVGLMLLAPGVKFALYGLLALAVLGVVRLWHVRRNGGQSRQAISAVALAMLAMALGIAMAAGQLAPLLELRSLTARAAPDAFTVPGQYEPLTALQIADLVAPSMLHGPMPMGGPPQALSAVLWRISSLGYGYLLDYVGLIPMVLALVAVARRHDHLTISLTGLTFGALAYTTAVPLWSDLVHAVLRYTTFYPYVVKQVAEFGLVLLAAFGFDHLLARRDDLTARRIAGAAVWLLGLGALGSLALIAVGTALPLAGVDPSTPTGLDKVLRIVEGLSAYLPFRVLSAAMALSAVGILGLLRWGTGAVAISVVVAVASFDLLSMGWLWNPFQDRSTLYPKTSSIEFLAERLGSERFMQAQPSDYASPVTALPNNVGMLFGLHSAGGYSALLTTQYLDLLGIDYSKGPIRWTKATTHPDSPLFDLLAVKYFVTPPNAGLDPSRFPLLYHGDLNIHLNPAALSRAYVVGRAVPRPPGPVNLGAFDFRREVAIEGDAPSLFQVGRDRPFEPAAIVRGAPNSVEIQTPPGDGGFLVLSDSYYPGWTALVDGNPTPVYRANYAFRAVALPPGPHMVTFVYDPPAFRVGIVTTASVALLILILLVIGATRSARIGRQRGGHARSDSSVQASTA